MRRVTKPIVRHLQWILIMIIALSLPAGCGGLDDVVYVSAEEIQLPSGSPGLKFWGVPTQDIHLARTEVTPPAGKGTYKGDAGDLFFAAGEKINMQNEGYAWKKRSGQWVFRFEGRLADSGEAFDITVHVDVSP
jgi:hypothetical protein